MELVAKNISEELAKRDHTVEVFYSDQGIDRGKPQREQRNLTLHPMASFEFAHIPFAPGFIFHMFKIPKGSIIHLHLSQAYYPEIVLFISKLRDIPYIVHFHLDVGPSGIFGPLFLLYKKIVWKPVLQNAKRVVVFSERQADLVNMKYGVRKDLITIIPNGVSEDFFSKQTKTFSKAPREILYVGRLSIQKRVERLVEAMSMITIPAHLTIVGDGEDREKLESLTRKLGLKNVSFEGRKDPDELHAYYEKADIFGISSDNEGMPLVLLEAMATGLPIIGSNVIGIQELLKGVGVLVDDPSPKTFASAISELLSHPEKLPGLSAASVKKARQYSWDILIEKLELVYRNIVP
jgi:rhamnosyl/mannosyltransferase